MHFNKKYDKSGSLFQGIYKAVEVSSQEQLVHLTRYIHLNPTEIANYANIDNLIKYPWSSYGSYINKDTKKYLHLKFVLKLFDTQNTYKNFVENSILDRDRGILQGSTLERVEP